METQALKTAEETLADYKKAAYRVTSFVMIFFLLRLVGTVIMQLIFVPLAGRISSTAMFIGQIAFSAVMLQIIPSIIGYFMFRVKRDGGLKRLYSVPKRMNKAIANFPALYGLGQAVNLLTILAITLITEHTDLVKSVNTLNSLQPPDTLSALILMFDFIVIAPVFEEFMFRGLILNSLKPFGNGFSVIVSGVIFGLFHGNFNQFFFTAVLGIALGYIANVTGSLLPTTILHAMFNSIGAVLLLLMSTDSVQRFILNGDTSDIPDGDMFAMAAFAIFSVCLIALIIIGAVSACSKLINFKRYKLKKVCPEISNGKKTALLLCSVPAIISILLIIDTFAGFSGSLAEGLIK